MIKDMSKIPYLTSSDLGKAREHLFSRNGKLCKNYPQDEENEVFCTIQMRNGNRTSFWMQRTDATAPFFARLFQDRRYNQHIEFIEWDDRINCVVGDGIYISQTNFFMTKAELEKFRKTIVPYDDIKEVYYGNKILSHDR